MVKKTKDHVFPDSWYPESTPASVQRWTVPSCEACNGKFGAMEKEVFVRLALCIDPRKAAAAGISKKALRSFGVGADAALDEEEKRKRKALMAKVFKDAKPYSRDVEPHLLPGIGPHPELPAEQQLQISLPAAELIEVGEKIGRGCEYWLNNGRIVEPPYEIEVFFVHEGDVPDVLRIFANFGPIYRGPGFQVRRTVTPDDPLTALYQMVIWGTLTAYASIMTPEAA